MESDCQSFAGVVIGAFLVVLIWVYKSLLDERKSVNISCLLSTKRQIRISNLEGKAAQSPKPRPFARAPPLEFA